MTILLDTGVFYGLFDRSDIHHLDSLALLTDALEGRFGAPYTTDYVVLEASLLIKGRGSADMARAFIRLLNKGGISTVLIDEESYKAALRIFEESAETLSLCDAASLTLMRRLDIRRLASYDERSFHGRVERVIGRGYFESLGEQRRKVIQALDKKRTAK